MYVREWALSHWEERTQVPLAEQLPELKRLINEAKERELRIMAEEEARLAAREAMHAAGFEHIPSGRRRV